MTGLYASGIFFDDWGNVVSPPSFSGNVVFHTTVFDNEYRKVIRANNLVLSVVLSDGFS